MGGYFMRAEKWRKSCCQGAIRVNYRAPTRFSSLLFQMTMTWAHERLPTEQVARRSQPLNPTTFFLSVSTYVSSQPQVFDNDPGCFPSRACWVRKKKRETLVKRHKADTAKCRSWDLRVSLI